MIVIVTPMVSSNMGSMIIGEMNIKCPMEDI